MESCLSSVMLLLGSGEGAIDLLECREQDLARELLQVAVEGVGVEQLKIWSNEEGEGSAKWEAKVTR